ncbi:gamma-aminobutyric acid type B receptor subunit 1 isoform X2 [Exaiptasia diaphana]|nr:gamma-aminobutyric acid type B receptor subunit 1 isoform X2 [Exaiptasia diaphana]
MLLGAGCSSVSRTVAQAAWQWNLIQVSYGSTASYLSNTKRYKLFYRVIPPDSSRIAALISFLKLNKWNRVALVGENDMGQTIIELTQELHKHNATIITSEILTEEPSKQMENIKAKDARIIISLVNQDRTKHVFCQAYQVGIYGRRYVWIFPFWFGDQWWLKDGSHCNKHQLTPPAHGNFFFDSTGLATSDKDAFGMSALQMKETLKKDPGFTNDFALFAFDAMWAMALTLHNAAKTLAEQNKTLEMFNYRSSRITAIMKSSLQSISFQGTTVITN